LFVADDLNGEVEYINESVDDQGNTDGKNDRARQQRESKTSDAQKDEMFDKLRERNGRLSPLLDMPIKESRPSEQAPELQLNNPLQGDNAPSTQKKKVFAFSSPFRRRDRKMLSKVSEEVVLNAPK